MIFPLAGIGAGSTDPDEMAAKITTLEGSLATMQAQLAGFILPDNRFHFSHLAARGVEFDYGPLGVYSLESTAAQAIPDNTATAISWSTNRTTDIGLPYSREPEPVKFSSNATSEIKVVGHPRDHMYLAWGHVQFDANSSGFREVTVTRHYGGSSISGDTINVAQAVASAGKITGVPFAVRWIGGISSVSQEDEHYLTIDARQDSGGTLNIIYASLAVARFY